MRRRHAETKLPGWLWFFLALPVGLVTVLLWRRKQPRAMPRTQWSSVEPPRYTEPDSIPIDTRSMGSMEPVVASADIEIPRDEIDLTTAEMEVLPVETAAAAARQETGTQDDLKLIEGIGPTIAGLLRQRGINSFKSLAATPVETLEQVLVEANLRRIADPGTWPEQAAFAASGDWEGLEAFQGTLKGGRRQ